MNIWIANLVNDHQDGHCLVWVGKKKELIRKLEKDFNCDFIVTEEGEFLMHPTCEMLTDHSECSKCWQVYIGVGKPGQYVDECVMW